MRRWTGAAGRRGNRAAARPALLADLTAPRWSLKSNGIQIEDKVEIKKRIGRSPDKGEACIYANVSTPKRNVDIGRMVGLAGMLRPTRTSG